MNNNKNQIIKKIRISLASPEQILKWARGTEVTKSETINYKTLKPEFDGLFCERIFGPVKDYECACGKYKKIKNKGKVCEKCGVEITEKEVRFERMSCIKLVYPCTHIWFSKELPNPSKISLLLDITYSQARDVIYFVNNIVLKNENKTPAAKNFYQEKEIIPLANLKENQHAKNKIHALLVEIFNILTKQITNISKNDSKYDELSQDLKQVSDYKDLIKIANINFEWPYIFGLIKKYLDIEISTGSAAIKYLLQKLDLKLELKKAKIAIKKLDKTSPKYHNLSARIQTIQWFISSGVKPEWMVLDYIPVVPPETRPIIQLDNGRFTTSDINTFYRKIIIRNERLKALIRDNTPAVILDNEKRLLQESVDGLFDNSTRTKPTLSKDKRPLKSLTDHLKGKQGLFRQNLLGKRVDYSGRSVIVVGPNLKMYQVGLPIPMALTLFKPFLIHELITKYDDSGFEIIPIAKSVNEAERLILKQDDVIWPILDKVIKTRPVLLNRAPSLHRLSIQAFEPKLIDGNAIRLHPLVTTAFNADFDGDQMGVYVPLSKESIAEARTILLASWHILGPKDGKPIITPTQDMILGAYYISRVKKQAKGEGTIFSDPLEAKRAYETKQVSLHAIVGISTNCYSDKGLPSDAVLLTTIGKIMFNDIMPKTMPYINNAKDIFHIDNQHILATGSDLFKIIDELDVSQPFTKKTLQEIVNELYVQFPVEVVAKTMDAIKDIGFNFSTLSSTTISAFDLPRYDKKTEYFKEADVKVHKLKKQFEKGLLTDDERYIKVINLWSEVKNKVTNDIENIIEDKQFDDNSVITMAKSGARGNASQFTQLLGMRGLMSKSYNYDQKTKSNIIRDTIETPIKHNFLEGLTISEYFNSSYGARKGMADTAMKTSKSGYMTRKLVDAAQEVIVREDDCQTTKGLLVEALIDTQQNNAVIEELWERIANRYAFEDIINPKDYSVLVPKNTIITVKMAKKIQNLGIKQVMVRSVLHCRCKNGVCQKCFGNDLTTYKPVEIGTAIGVIAAQSIGEPGTQLTMRTFHTGGAAGGSNIVQGFERLKQLFDLVPPSSNELAIIADIPGKVTKVSRTNEGTDVVVQKNQGKFEEKVYHVDLKGIINVKVGDEVKLGDKLTQGSINIKNLLKIAGIDTVRNYMIKEIQKVYRIQGIEISDKYIEIIIRQLSNKFKIENPGDSNFVIGQIVEYNELINNINILLDKDKILPVATNVIYGLDNVAMSKSGSFFAAASFQDTKKILTDAAIRGDCDNLQTLKENVMLGNLLPIGTCLLDPLELIQLGKKASKNEY